LPERLDLRRFGDADRQEIRLDQQDRPARPRAGNQVRHRGLGVGDMVQHGAGRQQVKVRGRDRPRADVALAQLQPGHVRVGQRQVEIHRHRLPTGRHPFGKPGRDGAVATANFERPRSGTDTQPLNAAAVHRIKQPRHQGQPLPLARQVMIKNVIRHAGPPNTWPRNSAQQTRGLLSRTA
jgi:hypothetical protein